MPTRSPIRKPSTPSTDRIDPTDDLVARNDGQLRIGQFAVDDMQVRAADAASRYLDPDLARSRMPVGRSVHSSAVLSFLSTIACMAASLFTVKAHFAVDRLIKVADLEPAN